MAPKDFQRRPGPNLGSDMALRDDPARRGVEGGKGLETLKGSLPAARNYPGKEVEREAARRHRFRASG